VANDVGGHKELIHDGRKGLLFKAGSREALSDALLVLLENREQQEKLEQGELEWVVDHHAWMKTTAVYEAVYRNASDNARLKGWSGRL